MISQQTTAYTFNKATKQITFTAFSSIALEKIMLVVDITNGITLYQAGGNFASLGGTVSANVLTLNYDTTGAGFNNSDKLLIVLSESEIYTQVMTSVAANANSSSTPLYIGTAKSVHVIVVATGLNTNDGIVKIQDNILGTGAFDDISGASLTLQAGTTQNTFRINGFTGRYLVVNWAKTTNSAGTLDVYVYAK